MSILIHTYIGYNWSIREKEKIKNLFNNFCNIFVNSLENLKQKICKYPHSFIASYNGTNDTINILNTIHSKNKVIGSYATASFLSSFSNFYFGLSQTFLNLNTNQQLPFERETIVLIGADPSSDSKYSIDLFGWSLYFARSKKIPITSVQEASEYAVKNPKEEVYIVNTKNIPTNLKPNMFTSESLLEKFLERDQTDIFEYTIVDEGQQRRLLLITSQKTGESLLTRLDSVNAIGFSVDISKKQGILNSEILYNRALCIKRSLDLNKLN
jgi:hypothetical protein